jgi:hypothetical protein
VGVSTILSILVAFRYDPANDRVAQPALLFSAPWHNRAPCMNMLYALLCSAAVFYRALQSTQSDMHTLSIY